MGARLKIGDVFEVSFDSQSKRYFQYIGNDSSQLNMDVLRAFKKNYKQSDIIEIHDVLSDEIDFYAQVTDVARGEKDGIYRKFGNSSNIGQLENIYFRHPNSQMGDPVSEKWFVWQVNHNRQVLNYTNKLVKKANIGVGMPPKKFIHRMQFGIYPFVYPKYPGEEN